MFFQKLMEMVERGCGLLSWLPPIIISLSALTDLNHCFELQHRNSPISFLQHHCLALDFYLFINFFTTTDCKFLIVVFFSFIRFLICTVIQGLSLLVIDTLFSGIALARKDPNMEVLLCALLVSAKQMKMVNNEKVESTSTFHNRPL